jgi:hypothetical protein
VEEEEEEEEEEEVSLWIAIKVVYACLMRMKVR